MLSLYAFSCGWFDLPRKFFIGGDDESRIRTPIPAYLIDHPKGLALFDTGLNARYRQIDKVGDFGVEFDESADIATKLRAMNIDPGAIKWIINSHLHIDHCGGNAFIPNATVVVQSRELAEARAKLDGYVYSDEDIDLGHPILAVDGEYDLYGDGSVMLFPTPGHTVGHQSVRVKLPDGDVVLTADCCNIRQNLDDMIVSPADLDPEASIKTLRHLGTLRDKGMRIFYGHDAQFWKSIPEATRLT